MPHGSRLIMVATRDVPRDLSPNRALYVAGRGVVSNDRVGQMPDRLPGMFTGDRPYHPAGTTTVTSDGGLEFWCFNWHANRGALPAIEPFSAKNAETVELEAGQRVLLCRGAIGEHGVGPFVADGGPMLAVGDVYGMLLEGDRG